MQGASIQLSDVVILDLEASGLGRGSWPIEVGLAWVEDGEIKTWSSLIRPEPDWDMAAWNPQAEQVHGISREELHAAPSASSVAQDLLARLAGRPVYSDAPEFDERWLVRLLDTAPDVAAVPVMDYDVAVAGLCGERGVNWAYEHLARTRTPHRAGPDAARMLTAICRGIERSTSDPGIAEP
jgi:DNA polymerase III subunit epsilon